MRKTEAGTILIADGFSCREQITQATERRPMHVAEVIAKALGRETAVVESGGGRTSIPWKPLAAGAAVALATVLLSRRR